MGLPVGELAWEVAVLAGEVTVDEMTVVLPLVVTVDETTLVCALVG